MDMVNVNETDSTVDLINKCSLIMRTSWQEQTEL